MQMFASPSVDPSVAVAAADLPVEPRDWTPGGEGADRTHQVDHVALLGAAAPVRTHTGHTYTHTHTHLLSAASTAESQSCTVFFCHALLFVSAQEPRVSLPGQQLQGRLAARLGHGAGTLREDPDGTHTVRHLRQVGRRRTPLHLLS